MPNRPKPLLLSWRMDRTPLPSSRTTMHVCPAASRISTPGMQGLGVLEHVEQQFPHRFEQQDADLLGRWIRLRVRLHRPPSGRGCPTSSDPATAAPPPGPCRRATGGHSSTVNDRDAWMASPRMPSACCIWSGRWASWVDMRIRLSRCLTVTSSCWKCSCRMWAIRRRSCCSARVELDRQHPHGPSVPLLAVRGSR